MRVLFLSVSTGGGHFKAAEAIKERVEERYPGSETLIIDTLKYVNPIVDKVIVGGYLNTVKKTPQIYGKLYDFTENGDNILDFSKTVNRLLSSKIRKLIGEFDPSVIVCTHPFPLQMLSVMKKSKKVSVPTIAIITDYASHPFWLPSNIDAYVVAHKGMKGELINYGISENLIHPVGLPVTSDFLKKRDRNEILRELQLEDRTTVLLMGGSLGFGKVREVFKALVLTARPIQIIAITGKNPKLRKQLEEDAHVSKNPVKIFSYTNKVADLMEISDFIITKPGGITITEALVKSKPIIVTNPLPGVEQRNAKFLTNNGAAVRLINSSDIGDVLNQIMDNPLKVSHMKAMAKQLSMPESSKDIVNLMEMLVYNLPHSKTQPAAGKQTL